jgi:hypothetical protein
MKLEVGARGLLVFKKSHSIYLTPQLFIFEIVNV